MKVLTKEQFYDPNAIWNVIMREIEAELDKKFKEEVRDQRNFNIIYNPEKSEQQKEVINNGK